MTVIFPRIAPIAVALLLSISTTAAEATVINFQDTQAGTGLSFVGAGDAQTLTIAMGGYDVVFRGGTPLGPNIASLPSTASVAYGTADFANTYGQSGYTNPLTIQFFNSTTHDLANVSNFFLDLYNGNIVPIDYTLKDNLGQGAVFNVDQNFYSGQHTFGFASAGNSFTVMAGPSTSPYAWDFFINNIGFNELLPPGSDNGRPISPVPEPSTNAMLLLGLGLISFMMYRSRKNDIF